MDRRMEITMISARTGPLSFRIGSLVSKLKITTRPPVSYLFGLTPSKILAERVEELDTMFDPFKHEHV